MLVTSDNIQEQLETWFFLQYMSKNSAIKCYSNANTKQISIMNHFYVEILLSIASFKSDLELFTFSSIYSNLGQYWTDFSRLKTTGKVFRYVCNDFNAVWAIFFSFTAAIARLNELLCRKNFLIYDLVYYSPFDYMEYSHIESFKSIHCDLIIWKTWQEHRKRHWNCKNRHWTVG